MNIKAWTMLLSVFAVTGCVPGPQSESGFRLPDGDAQTGQENFLAFRCHSCHDVADLELPEPAQRGPVSVTLGGPVTRVQTYGELVSSIINPSHKLARDYPKEEIALDGRSRMTVYNDVMTVQQLIDLVAFLQSHYQVVPPKYDFHSYQS